MQYVKRRLVKWRLIANNQRDRVLERVSAIQKQRPLGVPQLHSYGWNFDGKLRLELEYVEGHTLAKAATRLSVTERQFLVSKMTQIVETWRKQDFVHGDLSPGNILIGGPTKSSIWFVDWILDLRGYEGTPAFASREVYLGRRGFDSDRYALDQVLKACGLC